jgi:hypothetical protein
MNKATDAIVDGLRVSRDEYRDEVVELEIWKRQRAARGSWTSRADQRYVHRAERGETLPRAMTAAGDGVP